MTHPLLGFVEAIVKEEQLDEMTVLVYYFARIVRTYEA